MQKFPYFSAHGNRKQFPWVEYPITIKASADCDTVKRRSRDFANGVRSDTISGASKK